MDRIEIVSVGETLKTPAGTFTKVVHVAETTPLESGKTDKWWVSGIGPVKDADMVLVQYGK